MAELYDVLDTDDEELGISPLGILVVVVYAMIGMAIFLNPNGELFDFRIGGLMFSSIALAKFVGLQRWENQGNFKKTLFGGLLAASFVGIITVMLGTVWAYTFATTATLAFIAKSTPCVFEELFFRAGVLLSFQRVIGTKGALIVQGFFFAAWHSYVADVFGTDLQYFIILWIGGIALGAVFLWTKDLLSSIVGHHIINLKGDAATILTPQVTLLLFMGVILYYGCRRFTKTED